MTYENPQTPKRNHLAPFDWRHGKPILQSRRFGTMKFVLGLMWFFLSSTFDVAKRIAGPLAWLCLVVVLSAKIAALLMSII